MAPPPNLFAFQSIDKDLAPNLRRYVLDQQNESLKRHGVFRVAVSGGSLPNTLAKALLAPSSGSDNDKVNFPKWEIFYADERCVPLDDENSNHKLIKDELLSQIPSDMGQPKVFPIDEKYLDDPQEMADQYEKTLVSIFAARDSVKLPLFDLILLVDILDALLFAGARIRPNFFVLRPWTLVGGLAINNACVAFAFTLALFG